MNELARLLFVWVSSVPHEPRTRFTLSSEALWGCLICEEHVGVFPMHDFGWWFTESPWSNCRFGGVRNVVRFADGVKPTGLSRNMFAKCMSRP